jgi:hypothetical protein
MLTEDNNSTAIFCRNRNVPTAFALANKSDDKIVDSHAVGDINLVDLNIDAA